MRKIQKIEKMEEKNKRWRERRTRGGQVLMRFAVSCRGCSMSPQGIGSITLLSRASLDCGSRLAPFAPPASLAIFLPSLHLFGHDNDATSIHRKKTTLLRVSHPREREAIRLTKSENPPLSPVHAVASEARGVHGCSVRIVEHVFFASVLSWCAAPRCLDVWESSPSKHTHTHTRPRRWRWTLGKWTLPFACPLSRESQISLNLS